MAWVQLFCSILAVLLTALPCVRRLACHCGLLCATASHEFLIFLVVWAAGIPAVLAGMFAVSLLWDSSPSFTVCILLVVLPLVMATVIWCCLRSEWLLPIDVREQALGFRSFMECFRFGYLRRIHASLRWSLFV